MSNVPRALYTILENGSEKLTRISTQTISAPTTGKSWEEYPDLANQGESGKDIDEGESEEEIHVTELEEVVTSVVKDLSIDYTDDEDDYEVSEPQPLTAAKRNPQNRSSHSLTKSGKSTSERNQNKTLHKYSENSWGIRLPVQTGHCKTKPERTSHK